MHQYYLHDDVLPEPFVGFAHAPVVVLSNNAGYTDESLPLRNDAKFRTAMRQNLAHTSLAYPLVFLAPEFRDYGIKWWQRKTKHLITEFGMEIVAKSILNVTYFPYISRRFGHDRLRLPSQAYSFHLVREAMKQGAVIVHFRRDDIWLYEISELKEYPLRLKVRNTQNPSLSPGNLDRNFQKVRTPIAAAGA
jgi:hypothetical protein